MVELSFNWLHFTCIWQSHLISVLETQVIYLGIDAPNCTAEIIELRAKGLVYG